MKIAFVSSFNPHDQKYWSGSLYYIFKTLCKRHEVTWLGANFSNGGYWYHRFLGKSDTYYPENFTTIFAKILSKEINQDRFDVVIIKDYFLGIGLEVNVPLVYISDTTFDLFKPFLNINNIYYNKLAETTEQQLIDNVDMLLFSSEWAKENAMAHYHAKESKVQVVDFGANIPHPVQYEAEIQMDVCNIVFIGRSWENKGGGKVLETYQKLKAEGFACTCTIIGSTPPNKDILMDLDLTIIPHLDKSNNENLNQFCNILKKAHFLMLPTQFDAFGIVFCEASAYGVPSITANVGGVSQPIKEGRNGFLLPKDATAEDYARKIKTLFSDKYCYTELRKSSRREYETRLNWDVWGEKVDAILEKTKNKYRRRRELIEAEKQVSDINDFYIPVYVINLRKRTDRRRHIESQFKDKPEFELNWIDAVEHPIGAVGLWKSIVKATEMAIKNDDDIIIICEDDHTFTPTYKKDYLFENIAEANEQGAELLSGGIGGFGTAVPIAKNRFWVDWFWSTQFIVILKPLFKKILGYNFKDTDTADGVLSLLSEDKMTIYPFISIQKNFGYSDVTRSNNNKLNGIENLFIKSDYRLNLVQRVAQRYRNRLNNEPLINS